MSRVALVITALLVIIVGWVWLKAPAPISQTGYGAVTPTSTGAPAAESLQSRPEPTPPPTPPPTVQPALAQVDSAWLAAVAGSTRIPERALRAYASADLVLQKEQPACAVGWNTLAAIGWVESAHGTHDGAALNDTGTVSPSIIGPRLDGIEFDAITDTDDGVWDGDQVWDRAVGPFQFIPQTWAEWGADGSGDGVADPNQLDDAALSAARYLCASGSMDTPQAWRAAIHSFNHLDSYVDDVADAANHYASLAP